MDVRWVFSAAVVAAVLAVAGPAAALEVVTPGDQVAAASASANQSAATPVAVEEPAAVSKPKRKPKARCQRIGFSVNDYGKAGPMADAQKGLDAYAVRFAAERKINSYKLGKKSVSCKLFLDFGLFDEYTCLAEANFCY